MMFLSSVYMNPTAQFQSTTAADQEVENWFGELFHQLKTHKLMLTTGTAPTDMQAFYQALMQKNLVVAATQTKDMYNRTLTSTAVVGFMQAVSQGANKPQQLAFSAVDSALLVWAIVRDDDEEAERNVYLAEAEVNSQLRMTGFRINSTVVEESDKFAIPAHYQVISLSGE